MIIPLTLSSLIGILTIPPVKIETCEVSTPTTSYSGDSALTMVGVYGVHVRFIDASNRTISRVSFALNDGTDVVDVGTFSPDVTIDHFLPLPETDATSCTVASVTFADGKSWKAE